MASSVGSITAFAIVYLLENMINKHLWGIEQFPEEITCLAMLIGNKSGCFLEPKRLVENPPMQSPSIAVRNQSRWKPSPRLEE